MSDAHILEIVPTLFEVPTMMVKTKIVKSLLGLPAPIWNKLGADVIYDLIQQIAWIWKTPLSQGFLESFSWKSQTFYLPKDNLKNISIIEFAMAEKYLKAFTSSNPEGHALNELVATLCRPMKKGIDPTSDEYGGDLREKFNSDLISNRAIEFRSLNINIKMAVLRFFIDCVAEIQKKYSMVYPKPEPDSEPEPQSPAQKALSSFGMLAVLMDLAEAGTFGTWEEACFTNIHTILLYLTKQKLDQMEHERLQAEQRLRTKSS